MRFKAIIDLAKQASFHNMRSSKVNYNLYFELHRLIQKSGKIEKSVDAFLAFSLEAAFHI